MKVKLVGFTINVWVKVYFVDGSEIPLDQVALFRIYEDAVVIVIADLSDHDALLADGQKATFQRRHLKAHVPF